MVDNLVPAWLAPNVITLLGLAAVVLGNAVAVYHSPTLIGAVSVDWHWVGLRF